MTKMEFAGQSAYFNLNDGYNGNNQTVRLNVVSGDWSCTCFYWSVKMKECSHIKRCRDMSVFKGDV